MAVQFLGVAPFFLLILNRFAVDSNKQLQVTFEDRVVKQPPLTFPYPESVLTFEYPGQAELSVSHKLFNGTRMGKNGAKNRIEIPESYPGTYYFSIKSLQSMADRNINLTVDFVGCRGDIAKAYLKCVDFYGQHVDAMKPGDTICTYWFNELKSQVQTSIDFRTNVNMAMCQKLFARAGTLGVCLSDGTRYGTVCEAMLKYTYTNKITMETADDWCLRLETDSDFGWTRGEQCNKERDFKIFYDSTYRLKNEDPPSKIKFCVYCPVWLQDHQIQIYVRPLNHTAVGQAWNHTLVCVGTTVQMVEYTVMAAFLQVVTILVKREDAPVRLRIRSQIFTYLEDHFSQHVHINIIPNPICAKLTNKKTGSLTCLVDSREKRMIEASSFSTYRWYLNNKLETSSNLALLNLKKEGDYYCKMIVYALYCPMYETDKLGPFEANASKMFTVSKECLEFTTEPESKGLASFAPWLFVIGFSILIVVSTVGIIACIVVRKVIRRRKNAQIFSRHTMSMTDDKKDTTSRNLSKTKSLDSGMGSESKTLTGKKKSYLK